VLFVSLMQSKGLVEENRFAEDIIDIVFKDQV
jgi:hypothetical protein